MNGNTALWPGGGFTYCNLSVRFLLKERKLWARGRRMLTIIQSGVTEPNLWDNSFLVGGAEWVWGCKMLNSWRTVALLHSLYCCIVA